MRHRRRPAWRLAAVLAVVLVAGCDRSDTAASAPPPSSPASVATGTASPPATGPVPPQRTPASPRPSDDAPRLAAVDDRLQTFDRLAEATGLVDRLSASGPVTVFAPTDAAFASAEAVAADKRRSRLPYHVVPGTVTIDDLTAGRRLRTWAGDPLAVARARGNVFILDGTGIPALLLRTDLRVGDVTVHVIDRVLLPDADPRRRVDGLPGADGDPPSAVSRS